MQDALIDGLSLEWLPGAFTVCRLDAGELPAWAFEGSFCSVVRSAGELSVVVESHFAPQGVPQEGGWVCLRVKGTLDFSLTGVLASLALPLANAGIPIFAISTFDTDYLLVKREHAAQATNALRAAGHALDDWGSA